jgi:hypothetical protein
LHGSAGNPLQNHLPGTGRTLAEALSLVNRENESFSRVIT